MEASRWGKWVLTDVTVDGACRALLSVGFWCHVTAFHVPLERALFWLVGGVRAPSKSVLSSECSGKLVGEKAICAPEKNQTDNALREGHSGAFIAPAARPRKSENSTPARGGEILPDWGPYFLRLIELLVCEPLALADQFSPIPDRQVRQCYLLNTQAAYIPVTYGGASSDLSFSKICEGKVSRCKFVVVSLSHGMEV